MVLRRYRTSDCKRMAKLFYETVHSVNAADYTEENVDLAAWDKSFLEHFTIVAEEPGDDGKKIVGFGDIDSTGYLDRLYVQKDYQRRGIASAICDELENAVDAARITTHASITARPFFLKRGYRVVREQQVERGGILLTNYVMEKYC